MKGKPLAQLSQLVKNTNWRTREGLRYCSICGHCTPLLRCPECNQRTRNHSRHKQARKERLKTVWRA